ncbi:MAG: hypothetical protein HJJLKODD_02900 [Phycisphaerae bacterium]|nr:hypothetical protein [Phycisphaerae bacterium]
MAASLPIALSSAAQPWPILDFTPLPSGNRCHVLLVYCNLRFLRPHLGLAVLSACLKKIGVTTELCDLTVVPPMFRRQVLQTHITKAQPDLVGFTAMSHEWADVRQMIAQVRQMGIPHIIGGPQASEQPEQTMEGADLLVIGEGEGALLDVVRAIFAGRAPVNIPNTWWRSSDGTIHRQPKRPLIEDLDVLPFPDWQLFNEMHYQVPVNRWSISPQVNAEKAFTALIEGSRGCPYRCTYCSNSSKMDSYKGLGKWRREKSAARIVEELEAFRSLYGRLERVHFMDEVFMTAVPRLAEFSRHYAERIRVPFSIMERPENITEEKTRLMAEAGCMGLSIGLESGDEQLRRTVLNRKTKAAVIERSFKLPRKYGIAVRAFTMVGVPGQDEASLLSTWRFFRRTGLDAAVISVFRPVRGTVLYEECVRRGLHDPRNDELPWLNQPIIEHDRMDKATIVRYEKLLAAFGTRLGWWPVVAFHLGRRSDLWMKRVLCWWNWWQEHQQMGLNRLPSLFKIIQRQWINRHVQPAAASCKPEVNC